MFVAMIELTNPSGVCKVMTPDEYVELLNKYVMTAFARSNVAEWHELIITAITIPHVFLSKFINIHI